MFICEFVLWHHCNLNIHGSRPERKREKSLIWWKQVSASTYQSFLLTRGRGVQATTITIESKLSRASLIHCSKVADISPRIGTWSVRFCWLYRSVCGDGVTYWSFRNAWENVACGSYRATRSIKELWFDSENSDAATKLLRNVVKLVTVLLVATLLPNAARTVGVLKQARWQHGAETMMHRLCLVAAKTERLSALKFISRTVKVFNRFVVSPLLAAIILRRKYCIARCCIKPHFWFSPHLLHPRATSLCVTAAS